ncbi:hypothetical protein Pmani_002622 [Petrolisthes manimaculis]|uniref:Uncharacterized protein n=1 Tax=Petrolisthes manimaculis TaxID=1843537 RepID=A0AAE1QI62_9EUCA|nr:hypothetical protein Pmani_002622 [Petrolisthes manimaculis]
MLTVTSSPRPKGSLRETCDAVPPHFHLIRGPVTVQADGKHQGERGRVEERKNEEWSNEESKGVMRRVAKQLGNEKRMDVM